MRRVHRNRAARVELPPDMLTGGAIPVEMDSAPDWSILCTKTVDGQEQMQEYRNVPLFGLLSILVSALPLTLNRLEVRFEYEAFCKGESRVTMVINGAVNAAPASTPASEDNAAPEGLRDLAQEPGFDKRVSEALRAMALLPPVTIRLTPAEAYLLIAQVQLALRHPENTGLSATVARTVCERMTRETMPDSLVRSLVEMGFHPEFDGVREAGGSPK